MKSFIPRNHIPGRDYSSCIRGAVLTDAIITRYIRSGHYGPDARNALLLREASEKKLRASRPSNSMAAALRLLA